MLAVTGLATLATTAPSPYADNVDIPEEDICDVPIAEEDIDAIGLVLLLVMLEEGGVLLLLVVVDVVVMLLFLLNGDDEVGTLDVVGVDTR